MENKIKTTAKASAYTVFMNNYDMPKGTIEVTEWSNGQGIDIEIKVGREKSLGLFVSWKQCDQIGCFRTVLGYKFLTKVAQIFADCF